MFKDSIIAIVTAARTLFKNRRAFVLMLVAYAGLLTAVYVFVSTREATISQLILTMALVIVAPALFFVLQAVSVSYTNGPLSRGLISNCLKMMGVSVPVIGVTVLSLYGLSKVQSYVTITTTLRYLLIGVIAPLLAIQLWIATSSSGFRSLIRSLRKAFAPQSVFVYACGFLIFAVAPYFLIIKTIPAERAWLEFSLLLVRLTTAAVLILLGWVTTVGAISILHRRNE
jgi:hypothetical protein